MSVWRGSLVVFSKWVFALWNMAFVSSFNEYDKHTSTKSILWRGPMLGSADIKHTRPIPFLKELTVY